MLVGSAALHCYGAKLLPYDPLTGRMHERPHDVDLVATPSYMNTLYEEQCQRALVVAEKQLLGARGPVLHVQTPEDLFDIDLISQFNDYDSFEKQDANRRKLIQKVGRPLAGTAILIASPEHIDRTLKRRASDPKARQDRRSFNNRQIR